MTTKLKIEYKNPDEYNQSIFNSLRTGYHNPNLDKIITRIYELLADEKIVSPISREPEIKFYNHPNEYKPDNIPVLDNSKISKRLATNWIKVIKDKKVDTAEAKEYLYTVVSSFKTSDAINALYKRVHEVKHEGNDTIFNAKYFFLYPLLTPFTEDELFHSYSDFLLGGVWWYRLTKDIAHVILTPKEMRFDPQNNLHSGILSRPAVQWLNGDVQCYLWGIHFDKEMWENIVSKRMTSKEALKITNIEQRSKALRFLGYEDLVKKEYLVDVKEKHSKMKDKKTGKLKDITEVLELYSVPGVFKGRNGNDIEVKVLKYACPSTGRIYFDTVEPSIKDALEAMASKFKLTKQQYVEELTIEA